MFLYKFFKNLFFRRKNIFYVDTKEKFDIALDLICQHKEIGIDTEFDWRTTYLPKLSIIQISTRKNIFIIDCLSLNNFKKLKIVLEDKEILKIFHSVRSDSTVLSKCLGIFVNNVFDIQQAEKEISNGDIKSYGFIVNKYLNIFLKKGETNSNWLKRPLSEKQLSYASEDVDFLIHIFHIQKKILSQERLAKTFKQSNLELNLGNQSLGKLRLKKRIKKLSKKEQKIFIWRENLAMKENVPPNFIFKEKHVSFLAKLISKKNHITRSTLLKIIGDTKYVEEFILKFS
jgi:ribonuclease D